MDAMDGIVQALRNEGRTVIGPVVSDGVITHEEIRSVTELPAGWTEDQEGGRYRLEPTNTEELLAFSSPSSSWKRFMYPERTLLVRAHKQNGSVRVDQPEPEPDPVAFFGIRSCDLAALGVLDRVFLDPQATDPTYGARRTDAFIVAAACGHPGNTCFCASMDTGPSPRAGFDLTIRELFDVNRHDFLVEAGSDRGASLLAGVSSHEASAADIEFARTVHDHAVAGMGRDLRPQDPPIAAQRTDHSRWDDVANRCLACGNCTMVCPTCFCSRTTDSSDLTGTEAERWRVWDSCFSLDFTHLHGGSVRTTTRSRYRQWLLHKLVTWHDQFNTSGCVGCGRCITWCPVGIDLTTEIAALARPDSDEEAGKS